MELAERCISHLIDRSPVVLAGLTILFLAYNDDEEDVAPVEVYQTVGNIYQAPAQNDLYNSAELADVDLY